MAKIFDKSQRLAVPIHQIGDPAQRCQYHDENWGSDTYYADYAGLAYLLRPRKILEMGVFLGYSACAMILGAGAGKKIKPSYLGLDAELVQEGSNAVAITNIAHLCPTCDDAFVSYFLLKNELPTEAINGAPYDLINVDADHQADGTYQTLRMAWSILAPGGTLILDDTNSPLVQEGLRRFLFRYGIPDDEREHPIRFQWYNNETGWVILQKDR